MKSVVYIHTQPMHIHPCDSSVLVVKFIIFIILGILLSTEQHIQLMRLMTHFLMAHAM